ncbi:helix-turn-helix domain-containing protein [Empedobacter sp.]|uniref:helix-turn-helix domain-containing protein n=1 Tax=Empedobacter sp. TaxID=1927715 RepID=UPI0028A96681|nr:helix-turn-helix domain-containing protein [Empedobacter sp.]
MKNDLFLQNDGEALKDMKLLLIEFQKTFLLLEENQKFYDNADLKSLLNVSDKTLYRMRKTNKIPYIKFENKFYYPKQFFNQMAL